MKENKGITICISCHNNLNYLRWALTSVLENNVYNNELVIHAENCTDGTDEYLLKNYPNNCFIDHNDNPKGIGGGINYAMDQVLTDYVYLLHADMVVPANFDYELYKYFEKEEYKDKRLIVSSWRCEPDIWGNPEQLPGLITVPQDTFGIYYNTFNYNSFKDWSELFSSTNKGYNIKNAGGAGGFMIRKSDWDYLGGNDDIFKPACYEDIDLFLRAQIKEFEFVMTTDTILYHFAGRGSHWQEDIIGKKSERQMQSEQIGYQKWLEKWGERPINDTNTNFIALTDNKLQHYLKNKNKYLY